MEKIIIFLILVIFIIIISGCTEIVDRNCVLKDIRDCCGVHKECFFYDEEPPVYKEESCEGGICMKKECLCSDPLTIPRAIACKLEDNKCKTIYESKEPIGECALDSDCATGGCSGQLCGEKDKIKGIITTCEWREIYDCYKLTSCGCVDGKCQWKLDKDYLECLAELK